MYLKQFCFAATFVFFVHIASAQKGIAIGEISPESITIQNGLSADSLKYYPYCTISISVYNFDKLNKKEFRNQSNRLQSFALNAGIKGRSICSDELNVPVFVVNYEKDKFTQMTHQQGVLINKLLVNKDGNDYPSVSIYPKTVEKVKNADYIEALQQVSTLLKNTTSLNLVANVSNITSAFAQYINSICTSQEGDYEWSFPVIPASDVTRPYKDEMFVIKPNSDTYAGGNFIIKNGEAWSVSSENEFTKLPYILVTTSFSGYFADDKLPSTLAIQSLDRMSIDASRLKLYEDINRLSKEQFDAESHLLEKYESYLKIRDLVALIPQYTTNADIKTQTVNEWMAYMKEQCPVNYFFGNDIFIEQNKRLDDYTNNLLSQVAFYHPLTSFMKLYFVNAEVKAPKTGLVSYYKFYDMFDGISFIHNSFLFNNLCSRITEMEDVTYQNNYADPVVNLRNILLSKSLSDKEKLQQGQDTYNLLYTQMSGNTCRACNDSAFKVLTLYDQLDNNKLASSRTQDIMECTKCIDTLMACEGNLEAGIKNAATGADKKKTLLSEKDLLDKEAHSISQDKNTFMTMPLQPKNEFRAEKSKVENELEDAQKLIMDAKEKARS